MITPRPAFPVYENYSNRVRPDILASDPDIMLTNPSALPVSTQADLILQGMGGTELLYYARHDTVNGQSVVYQPLKDIEYLAAAFSPQEIINTSTSWKKYRASFSVQLSDKQLDNSAASSGSISVDLTTSGIGSNIVVELDGLTESDIVELAFNEPLKSVALPAPTLYVDGGDPIGIYSGIVDGGNSLGYNVDMSMDGGNEVA